MLESPELVFIPGFQQTKCSPGEDGLRIRIFIFSLSFSLSSFLKSVKFVLFLTNHRLPKMTKTNGFFSPLKVIKFVKNTKW